MKQFQHTFRDSGAVILCQKVPTFIASTARAAAQQGKPKPPVRVVTEEGPLMGSEEIMDKDPAYLDQVRLWNLKSSELLMKMQIKRAVVKVLEPENWQDLVTEYRLEREEFDAELKMINPDYDPEPVPEDDLTVFILFVAAATQEDMNEFADAISKRSYPNGEVADGIKESFRTPVPQ